MVLHHDKMSIRTGNITELKVGGFCCSTKFPDKIFKVVKIGSYLFNVVTFVLLEDVIRKNVFVLLLLML